VSVRFIDMPFGPFQLRPLLRATLRPGERTVGWAVAYDQATLSRHMMQAAISLLPGLGAVLVGVLRGARGERPRLLLLTDRRLLVLVATRGVLTETASLEADVALAELVVRCAGANDSPNALLRKLRGRSDPEPGEEYATRFTLASRSGWIVDLDIPTTTREPPERLREALVVLAIDSLHAAQNQGGVDRRPPTVQEFRAS
jgi:hypothetical protein